MAYIIGTWEHDHSLRVSTEGKFYCKTNNPSTIDKSLPFFNFSLSFLEEITLCIHHKPYSIVFGRENEPWNEEDMFSWTVITLACVDSKEGSTNCGTVSRIRRQQEILQNHSIVKPCNSTKQEQATVAGTETPQSLICQKTLCQRYDVTPASQRHDAVRQKWTSPHLKHSRHW